MATITFKVNFFNGEGSVVLDGEGIPKHTTIGSADDPTIFETSQEDHNQVVTISGIIPNDEGGKITVAVLKDGEVISPASNNVFEPSKDEKGNYKYTFTDFLTYEI